MRLEQDLKLAMMPRNVFGGTPKTAVETTALSKPLKDRWFSYRAMARQKRGRQHPRVRQYRLLGEA
jgi:hypothetical protein